MRAAVKRLCCAKKCLRSAQYALCRFFPASEGQDIVTQALLANIPRQRIIHDVSEASPNTDLEHLVRSRYKVEVACKCSISIAADIRVTAGKMEEISTKMYLPHQASQLDDSGRPQPRKIANEAHELAQKHVSIGNQEEPPSEKVGSLQLGRLLEITIPERYCSLQIDSFGGAVSIEKVHEASLSVKTHGGDIHLGAVKASSVVCNAQCGSVTAKTLIAERLEVFGKSVSLGRVMGKDVTIKQQLPEEDGSSPPFSLTAAYVEDKFLLDSGNAALEIGTFSSKPGVAVIRSGQKLEIQSFDGRADIISEGDATVHGQDNLEVLKLKSSGSVQLKLSPHLAKTVELHVIPLEAAEKLPQQLQCRVARPGFSISAVDSVPEGFLPPKIFVELDNWNADFGAEVESWIESLKRRREL